MTSNESGCGCVVGRKAVVPEKGEHTSYVVTQTEEAEDEGVAKVCTAGVGL